MQADGKKVCSKRRRGAAWEESQTYGVSLNEAANHASPQLARRSDGRKLGHIVDTVLGYTTLQKSPVYSF